MTCKNCGAELKPNAKFCAKCGTPVNGEARETAPSQAPALGSKAMSLAGSLKKSGKLYPALGIAAVVLAALIYFFFIRKPTINLNEYLKISYSGFDTVGMAEIVLDEESLINEYGKKEAMKGENDSRIYDLFSYIYFQADKTEGLANGDTVTVTWEVDEEGAKEDTGFKLTYEDVESTVEGLKPVPSVDPFQGISVVYEGTAPNGRAEIEKSDMGGISGMLRYSLDKAENLSNGDVVTVRIEGDAQEIRTDCIEQFGMAPSTLEKEYTVEGLPHYPAQFSEISEDALEEMKRQAEDVITARTASDYGEEVSLQGMTYAGAYFLTVKEGHDSRYSNLIDIIYRVDAGIAIEEAGYNYTLPYYFVVQYQNAMILPDGTCSVDTSEYSVENDTFTYDTGVSTGWGTEKFRFEGYENTEVLKNTLVTEMVEDYACEDLLSQAIETIPTEETTAAETENAS